MRVSRSTGYAVLAVCYIAKNQDSGSGVILSQSVSKEYDIPLEYLLKILQQLVRANVLRSKRGPRGGFSLAKPTNKITMLEIIEAVDGPMSGELNLVGIDLGRHDIVRCSSGHRTKSSCLSQCRVDRRHQGTQRTDNPSCYCDISGTVGVGGRVDREVQDIV